ncbi:MAG: threonine/serine dehydratase [Pseudomonadota bacterium]
MNIEMIQASASRAAGHVRYTPMLSSPFLDEIAGRRVLLKAECLQHTGSFKYRGAWSAVSSLDQGARARGVIAFSSGNHAQAIALSARHHGTSAVIVMPSDAPVIKIDNTRALGAEVVLYDREREDRLAIGEAIAKDRGLTLIQPFDEPQVIAGQGTCGLEIAQQAAEMGAVGAPVLVCCGGGGFTSGVALALEGTGHSVHPVEPEGFDDVIRSMASGRRERNTRQSGSLCDAIVTPSPGELTFPIIQRLCGRGIVVSEDEAMRAVALAFLRLKVVLEPGGAVALAAALFHPGAVEGDAVIATASGGNIDADVFARALDTL